MVVYLTYKITIGSQYESRGCWKDRKTTPRTLTDIDIDIPKTFGSHYKKRKDPILHCLQAAIARGYVVFALQDGGQCFGSSSLKSYSKWGTSTDCARGLGGPLANDVYEIRNGNL